MSLAFRLVLVLMSKLQAEQPEVLNIFSETIGIIVSLYLLHGLWFIPITLLPEGCSTK